MGTIVALRGPEAAGKSMLHTLMIQGQSQYWSSSRLDGIRRHNSAFGIPTAFVFAYEGGLPLLPLVERAIADKDYLVLETVDADHGLLKEACGNFDLLRTWLVLPKWLLETPPLLGKRWPGWVYAVADSCGCAVTSIEPATVHPESRHIVRIERVTG